jgi:acyl-CoA thioesterase YciA
MTEPGRPSKETEQPRGSLSLRTLAMPADTNPNGDIFGGWLLSQMDMAGGLAAKQRSKGRIVTIAIDGMTFYQPVRVGDVVCCYADVEKVGRTSMKIRIQAWCLRQAVDAERVKVTEGVFTFVAIDENGKPRAVDRD